MIDAQTAAIDLIWHGDPDSTPLKEWLVDEMLPRTGLALIAGQWGTYKTFVMLDLSASVMTKAQFAGRDVHRQGGVLLLAAEGQSEVRLRVEGVARERVAAFKPAEDVVPIDPEHMPFVWRKSCPRLADPRTLDELRKIGAAAATGMKEKFGLPLALVVIDALTTAAQFRDADDTAENQRALNMLVTIAREFDTLVVVVDHFGKDASTGTRNASTKEDTADSILALLGEKELNGLVTNPRMALRKVRGGPNGIEIPFRVHEVVVQEFKTLVVDWTEEEPAAPRKRQWPKALVVFKRVFDAMLDERGKHIRPFMDGPEVLAVEREAVREEFQKAYSADTPKAKAVAFKRCVERASQLSLMCSREINGREFYWRMDVK
jgi:AAA domain